LVEEFHKFQKNFKKISEIFYKPPIKRIAYPCNLWYFWIHWHSWVSAKPVCSKNRKNIIAGPKIGCIFFYAISQLFFIVSSYLKKKKKKLLFMQILKIMRFFKICYQKIQKTCNRIETYHVYPYLGADWPYKEVGFFSRGP
jgi:hypothetical protein